MTTELEDEAMWPDERIAAAKAEILAEEQRRAAAKAAAEAASLSAEAREKIEMARLAEMSGQEGRKEVLKKFGFDPGWTG
jgi:hypothetical protein